MTMKVFVLFALFALSTAVVTKKDSTITKVVKLLQDMLDKSKTEGDEERVLYAKFKCYCDTSTAEKRASIKEQTDTIEVLESKIAEIQGETGELSSDVAELKASMADNEAAQKEATALRNKENTAFNGEEKDLTQAIAQMKSAIATLAAVGGDQTASTGADNKQFMAGHKGSLLAVQSQVQSALKAASALMTADQRSKANAFIQGPFTGTYTSQSAQVVGIIKSMRDTFIANLADARTTEKNSLESHEKFMEIKESAFKEMKDSYEEKQKTLGDNDGELSAKKKQLSEANKQKASDEAFLDSLLPMCADKAKGYSNRNLLRANEEAAIAEAISILDSDDAFATFSTSSATKTGKSKAALLQVSRHMTGEASARNLVLGVLEKAAKDTHSARLMKVLASLEAENPFSTVLDQIEKMIDLIGEEGKADKKKLDWCNKERKERNAALDKQNKDILSLETSIDKLTTTIDDPKTGLKKQIEETETQLLQNTESQKTETQERTEDNVAYQKDVKNLVAAQSILAKAIKVLNKYYDDLEKKLAAGDALVQEDPKAPEAWKGDGAYAGQSSKGGDVIQMLEFIESEANKEETTAHKDEEKSQADYEDSMANLKKEQATGEKTLVSLQDTLATKEKDLLEAQEDLKLTNKDKDETEAYLSKIKPGCDFITSNFAQRESSRKTEKGALVKAVGLIKATPAFKTAVNAATVESYGDCKEPCVKDAQHVKCKACQASVTIPAFCAGHKGIKGC